MAERRTLLVLDGVEPLQYPPGPLAGELKDPALATLLKSLAQNNLGLCIVTTRESITDLKPFQNTTAPEWPLDSLSEEAGSALLKSLLEPAKPKGRRQVRSSDTERREIVRTVKGHALTLQLLGGFTQAALGDVRKWREVNFTKADASVRGGYAFKTMSAYEKWLGEGGDDGGRQLAILRLLGLFDQPADAGCVKALREEPVIANLTEPIVGLGEDDWNLAIASLEECSLVSRTTANKLDTQNSELETGLDAHPLIREYFAAQLRNKNPEAWRAAHQRLYEHLCATTKEGNEPTLEDLQPLYQAFTHGVQAGMAEASVEEVYQQRIQRGDHFYTIRRLGALGADLSAAACLFDEPWSRPSPLLSESAQAWILHQAAFLLRGVGRLTEALEPMRAGLEMRVKQENWGEAARTANNVSELELTLGEVDKAVEDAKLSVTYADRCGESFEPIAFRATLADALHQAGCRAEAEARFREAEQLQIDKGSKYAFFYSVSGFVHSDFLLAEVERLSWRQTLDWKTANGTRIEQTCDLVKQRTAQTLTLAEAEFGFLSIALDHLTLGRAALFSYILKLRGSTNRRSAVDNVKAAVDGLRRAGQQDDVPRGLLTRAWMSFVDGDIGGTQVDLDEASEIAERGPMRLHMADIHLYRARLFHAVKPYPWKSPQEDLAAARKLIEQCGYWRRKEELEDAEAAAKNW